MEKYHADPDCKHFNLIVQRNNDYRWVTCTDCATDFYPRRKSAREIAEERGWDVDNMSSGEYLDILTSAPYPEDMNPRKWYEDPGLIPPEELAKWQEEHPGEEFRLDHEPEVIKWEDLGEKNQKAILRGLDDIEHGRVGPRILRSEVVERVDEETGDVILSRRILPPPKESDDDGSA